MYIRWWGFTQTFYLEYYFSKMTTSEKLCLQWNDFQNIVSTAFGDLRNDGDLTDVTLACEDGKQIESHKVVLAATSPFFLDLLKRNKHPHPLIYMKGIKSENLLAMVDFFYRGEANVSQENLEGFLALADEMRLKGLSRLEESEETLESAQFPEQASKSEMPLRKHRKQNPTENQLCSTQSSETTVALNNRGEVADVQYLSDQIDSMMEKGTNRMQVKVGNGKVKEFITRICKVCGKEGIQSDIKRHIESKHITGISQTCDICGQKAKTKNALRTHKSTYHRIDL